MGTKNPAQGRVFSFRGSGGRIGLRYAALSVTVIASTAKRSMDCFVAALLAKTGEENENGPHKGTHSSFGSGGALCTLARSQEPLAVLEVPLLAA